MLIVDCWLLIQVELLVYRLLIERKVQEMG
jgi:hypothetical protein